jgi:hypothetical protein
LIEEGYVLASVAANTNAMAACGGHSPIAEMTLLKNRANNSSHKTKTGTVVFIDEFSLWRHNLQRPYREPVTINK